MSSNRGFTFIELLITMAIASLMMTVVITVINPNQLFQQARDSKNMANVRQIANAFINYQGTRGKFPPISWPAPWELDGDQDTFLYNTILNNPLSIPSDEILQNKLLKTMLTPSNYKDSLPECNTAYKVRTYGNPTNGVTGVAFVLCMESWKATSFANYGAIRSQCITDATAQGTTCTLPQCFEDTSTGISTYYCLITDVSNMPPIKP